jgi:glutamate synthase domain-containing protein 3
MQMPSDEKQKQRNDSNGLERCPMGSDVGVFGKANGFVDGMTAGFIYATAIRELITQTKEIDMALAKLSEEEKSELLPTLEADLKAIDEKWRFATVMFSIEA